MAGTGAQINWTACTFTPTSGTAVTLTNVDSVSVDEGGDLAQYSGDANVYNTIAVRVSGQPSMQVGTSNPAQVMALVTGQAGVFTATHKDAKGVTGGDVVYTLSTAVVQKPSSDGRKKDFGTATVTFVGVSADGTTNPLAITAA